MIKVDNNERSREHWRDGLRGIVILLLLLQHATTRPYWSAGLAPDSFLMEVCAVLKPLRMPALMILSGSLLGLSLRKDPATFYVDKIRTLAWPFVIWVAVVMAVLGRLEQLAYLPTWIASSYLWFIYYLFTYFCMAPILSRLPAWVVPTVAILATLFARAEGYGGLGRYLLFLGLFFAGHDTVRTGLQRSWRGTGCLWLSGGSAYLSTAWILATAPEVRAATDGADLALLAWAGIAWSVFAIGLAQRFMPDAPVPLIGWLGRNSIVLYCTHLPIMIIVTTTLAGQGAVDPRTLAVVNLAVAVALGMLVIRYRERRAVGWLFEMPWSTAQILGWKARLGAVSKDTVLPPRS
ncbi:MAG: acyltransferase family protein [Nocardioides sp.]